MMKKIWIALAVAALAGVSCTTGTRCDAAHPCSGGEVCSDGQCGIALPACNTSRGECTKTCASLEDCPAGFDYCNFPSDLASERLCLSLDPGRTPACASDDDCVDAVLLVSE